MKDDRSFKTAPQAVSNELTPSRVGDECQVCAPERFQDNRGLPWLVATKLKLRAVNSILPLPPPEILV